MTPILFIDRDAWSGKLDATLRNAGIPFEARRDHFADDEERRCRAFLGERRQNLARVRRRWPAGNAARPDPCRQSWLLPLAFVGLVWCT